MQFIKSTKTSKMESFTWNIQALTHFDNLSI